VEFQRHSPSDFKTEIMLMVSHEWSQSSNWVKTTMSGSYSYVRLCSRNPNPRTFL